MPSPTMPTGTVSDGSDGSRTFPIRDEHRFDRPRDAAANANESNTRTDGRGAPPTLEAEVERLRAENEDLRRTLRETRERRQDVIDRYERLLDGDTDADVETESPGASSASAPTTPGASAQSPRASSARTESLARRLADELDARWTRLRRRYEHWERRSGL